jgi:hypothetical protein
MSNLGMRLFAILNMSLICLSLSGKSLFTEAYLYPRPAGSRSSGLAAKRAAAELRGTCKRCRCAGAISSFMGALLIRFSLLIIIGFLGKI